MPEPPDPSPEDDGSPDPALARVLAAYSAGECGDEAVLAALADARLIVPVSALPTGTETSTGTEAPTGDEEPAREKSVEMALPVMVGRDGRRALPAFTSLATMAAWDPAARPVPVPTWRAARGAVQESCAFLVVDPAGPVTWVADRAQVEALADPA